MLEDVLKLEIEQLRSEMVSCSLQLGCLLHSEVVEKSQRLDVLIVKYQQILKQKSGRSLKVRKFIRVSPLTKITYKRYHFAS